MVERAVCLTAVSFRDLGLPNRLLIGLLEVLAHGAHTQLSTLDLRGNALGVRCSRLLGDVVDACPCLRRLRVDAGAAGAWAENRLRALLRSRGGVLDAWEKGRGGVGGEKEEEVAKKVEGEAAAVGVV